MVHIAEIYFRAWKKASGKILEVCPFVYEVLAQPQWGRLNLVCARQAKAHSERPHGGGGAVHTEPASDVPPSPRRAV